MDVEAFSEEGEGNQDFSDAEGVESGDARSESVDNIRSSCTIVLKCPSSSLRLIHFLVFPRFQVRPSSSSNKSRIKIAATAFLFLVAVSQSAILLTAACYEIWRAFDGASCTLAMAPLGMSKCSMNCTSNKINIKFNFTVPPSKNQNLTMNPIS